MFRAALAVYALVALVIFNVLDAAMKHVWHEANRPPAAVTRTAEPVPPPPGPPVVAVAAEGPDYVEYLGRAAEARKEGRDDDAAAAYRQAIADVEKRFGKDNPAIAFTLTPAANFYMERERYLEAAEAALRIFELREKMLGPQAVLKDDSAKRLTAIAARAATRAGTLSAERRFAEAEAPLRALVAVRDKFAPPEYRPYTGALLLLLENLVLQRKIDEAKTTGLMLVDLDRKAYGEASPELTRPYLWLGAAYLNAGQSAEAEEVFRKAAGIWEKLYGEDRMLGSLLTLLGASLRNQAKFAEAGTLLHRGLALREELLPADDPEIAESLVNLALLYRSEEKIEEAEPLFRRSLSIREKAFGAESREALNALNGLGLTLLELSRPQEAEAVLRRALAGRERLPDGEIDVAETLINLMYILHIQGRFGEAAALAERPLEIYERVLGPDHPQVVLALEALALTLQDRADFAQAETLYGRALQIGRRSHGETHFKVADTCFALARLFAAERKFDEAVAFALRGNGIRAQLFGAEDPRMIAGLREEASLEIRADRLPEAEATLRRALVIAEKGPGAESVAAADLLLQLARVTRLEGGSGSEEELYRRPLRIYLAALGPRHPNVAVALDALGNLLVSKGRVEEALRAYDEAEDILTGVLGENAPTLAGILNNKALLFSQMKRTGEAEVFFRRAIDLIEQGTQAETSLLATVLANLADLYAATGRGGEARALKERSDGIFTRLYGDRRPMVMRYPVLPVWVRDM